MDFYRLLPLTIVLAAAVLVTSARRLRLALIIRRDRRAKAEADEYARITGWIEKIRPVGAGPAVQRDKFGNLVLFSGLRRYTRKGRRIRRSRET